SYEGRLHPSAIKWAIWEARLAGQRRASYLRAILDRLVAQGLTTAAAAQAYEEERRHRDRDRPPAAAGMDGAPNAAAYTESDRETVNRYAAAIYAAADAAAMPLREVAAGAEELAAGEDAPGPTTSVARAGGLDMPRGCPPDVQGGPERWGRAVVGVIGPVREGVGLVGRLNRSR